jgi:hypothetical protein
MVTVMMVRRIVSINRSTQSCEGRCWAPWNVHRSSLAETQSFD